MKFEIFKTVLLSFGICECEFYLHSSKKEGFIGYNLEKNTKKYCIVFDNIEHYFNNPSDILYAKVFDEKTIEETWDDIVIDFIDGLTDEEYVRYIDTPNFYLNEFVAANIETNSLDVTLLVKKLIKSEYIGNVILYAGTKELCDFSESDNTYTYYIYDTINKGIYLLKKENNFISFDYVLHWYQRKKLEIKNLSIGRKYDKFSSKSRANKSERYNLMLKLQKKQNYNIIGVTLGVLDIITFFLFIFGIALKSINSMLWLYSLIFFVLSMFFTIIFNIRYDKEYKKLNDKLFPKRNLKINYTDMFLQIQKEAIENSFNELHEALTHIDKKVKKSGGFFEDESIDLRFYTKKHEFFIMFYNKFALINIDEESINLEIKLKYIDYKDYYELESKIYSTIIEYL